MLERFRITPTRSVSSSLFDDHKCPDCRAHFGEVASCLGSDDFDALMLDLDAYDRLGVVSPRIADLKRRAQCIADADRIIAGLDLKLEN